MEDLKYNLLFSQKVNNLSTVFFARPMMYSINTFGKPMISEIIKKHYEHGFTQLYLCDEEGTLILNYDKMEVDKAADWEFFYDSIVKSKLFIEDVEYEEGRFAFKIRFPKKWKEDFDRIISGRYSKVSEMYMKKFYPTDDNLLYHLHYKTEKVIDHYSKLFNVSEELFSECEIGPIVNIEKETLKLSKSIAV